MIFVNIIGHVFYGTLDMTEEKRFTLTPATKKLLAQETGPIFIRVFLEGEFPAGFKRLQEATRDVIEDFRTHNPEINYVFDNPSDGNPQEINERRKALGEKNIYPTNLRVKDVDETKQLIIYPYALINLGNREVSINLLESEVIGVPNEVVLNNSVALLEYKLANAIQKLILTRRNKIIFLQGHEELNRNQVKDLRATLAPFYDTDLVNLDSVVSVPSSIDVMVIAKPKNTFSEKDKFKIDQYVMNGGKVMWLIDRLAVNLDSLQGRSDYIPNDYPLNIEDQLFKYGARVQPNLILDLECTRIPLVSGQLGSGKQFDLFPWYYHPLVAPKSSHPIVKSLDRVNLFFPSSVDTVKTKTPVKSTVLLSSSARSRLQFTPVRLDFEILRYEPDPSKFNKGEQPIAVLLEGEFASLYENRVPEQMASGLSSLGLEYKTRSVPNRMIVVGDGDIAKNLYNSETDEFQPLGYNKFERRPFQANKDFMINSIEYLMDDEGVIEARSKEVKLRMLDTVRARSQRGTWQFVNIGLPLIFLFGFGFLYNYWRRKKYGKHNRAA
ncbi:MAG: gliding motility-associated ABC transporter substrate-binding protein GldG [Saprospiraceae bacterium]|nr:gliding motility-associated ABC transporter substrate-binding protein GldG [Saprospiraceae bacterium]